MHEILVKRVQHPVGQGGFHMADMLVGDEPFRYIYDCGSGKPGAIEAVLAGLHREDHEKSFDWLVISSFDMDHFIGVKLLIDAGYTFKRVFLPHRLDKNLLVWLLCCYVLDKRSQAEIVAAIDALRVIRALDMERPEEPDGDNPHAVLEPLDPALVKAGKINVTYYVEDADWMFRFYSLETNFAPLVKAMFKRPEFAELKAIMERAADTVTGTAQNPDTAKILNELFEALGKQPGKPSTQRKARAAKIPTGTPVAATSSSATTTADTVKQLLGKAYESLSENGVRVFGDYNEVSLCLYSGPRTRVHTAYTRFTVECGLENRPIHPVQDSTRRVGWLGVGDMGFANQQLLDQFALYYAAELALACTKMVPHHGAQSNYGKLLPMLKPFIGLDTDQPLWVAAAHPLTRYRHPAGVVVMECQKNGHFAMVSDDPGSRIEETISSASRSAISAPTARHLLNLLYHAGYR
ncbi:hypothetical protein RBA41_27140 [Massilia sp. CCM 9210]|uniref:hypothetical protein n=1 Tax=Massilia scottii TaxID=3057166 RepID=UPI002796E26E|nr:hypothetical protein [Massilia sp. CCM 9210]MDQ1816986.1 hypothetical protein [Massilia sp. CCM 9210]